MNIDIKIIDQRLKENMPKYSTPGSAGLDLRACVWAPIDLRPGEVRLISVGFALHLADPGYAAVISPRSGMGTKGLVMGNTIGLIDSDYQGELFVCAWNRNTDPDDFIKIEPMDRIAQLWIVPVVQAQFREVEDFSASTARGVGGYGSTGVK